MIPEELDRVAVVVGEGVIDVPPGTNTDDFAEMESKFRHLLWPLVKPLWKRWKRKMHWSDARTKLHYKIMDIPSTTRSKT